MPESVLCNLCGGQELETLPDFAKFLRVSDNFGISRCNHCSLIFLNPRPTVTELQQMYHSHPYYQYSNAHRGASRTRFYNDRMERLEKWFSGKRGTMLYIGCLEGGYALQVAGKRGWSVHAVEFSPILAGYAANELSLNVDVAEAWDLSPLIGRQFDAIYTHSFEHVLNPILILQQCKKLLKPDGILLIEVPNQFYSLKDKLKRIALNRFGFLTERLFYREVVSDFHLYYFSAKTVRRMLQQEGYKILEMRGYLPWHPVYHSNRLFGLLQEGLYALGGPFQRGPSIEVIARHHS